MDKWSLLSVCIPTYNRDYLIQECLVKLCPVAYENNVQVHISDNASSDDTENIIKKFMRQYENVFYYKHDENMGADRNIEFVLKQPKTKYRWLLGDGYFISDDNIKKILRDLNRDEFDFYVVNATIRTLSLDERIYTDKDKLLSELGWHMTLLGCTIYNASFLHLVNYKKYYNSYFIQTGIIFEYCASVLFKLKFNPNIIINLIVCEKKNHWLHRAFEIFCKKWYMFVVSLPFTYSDKAKKECIVNHNKNTNFFSMRNILYWRSLNYFNMKTILKYKFYIYQSTSLSIVLLALLVSIVPVQLFYLTKNICRKLTFK